MNWWRSLSWTRLPRNLADAVTAEDSKTPSSSLATFSQQNRLWLILVIPLSVLLISQICRLLYATPISSPEPSILIDETNSQLFLRNAPNLTKRLQMEDQSIIHRLRLRLQHISQRRLSSPTATQTSAGFLLHNMEQIIHAGLGNFLFAVASVMGVARSTYRQPGLLQGLETKRLALFPRLNFFAVPPTNGLTYEMLKKFTIQTGVAGIHNLDIYRQIKQLTRQEDSTLGPLAILTGYMQSWRYFEAFHDEVRQRLQFAPSIYRSAIDTMTLNTPKELLDKSGGPYTLVGIHVRRGDMVNHAYGYQPASEAYLQARVAYFTRNYRNVLFIVVSNDMAYCRRLFQGSFVFIATANPPEVDMALLTLMDHLILSMGTFGWWSAYLSDATEIWFYKSWYKAGSGVAKEYVASDYFLPTWNVTDF